MKKFNLFFMLVAGLLASLTGIAQKDSSGIYKTADDFSKRKLSYAINYKTEKHTINGDMLFNEKEIKVKHAGVKYSLQKSETYGFRNTKGEEFRFIDNKEYKILNPREQVLIYSYAVPYQSPKALAAIVIRYFFTTNAANSPMELTKTNLKSAYPGNHKFHDAVDAQFKNDQELYAYDQFHKMYKLNWIAKNDIN